jgi:ATP-dependent helicase/nuclease subunit B
LRELSVFFDDLTRYADIQLQGTSDDLHGFVEGLLQGRLIPPDPNAHPRLRIWGLLEARLLPADLMIVGGCDESVWPPVAEADAFLNRPMAKALGLPSPEHRLGQTAHDFCQALGGERVILTRANKRKGDPMVRSRFLQRLQAVIGEDASDELRARGQCWLDLARALDRPLQALQPAQRPNPVPHPSVLPERLSITEIGTLRRDPYAIYARRILKLDPLDSIDRSVHAGDLGTAVHDALALFTRQHPDALPADAAAQLQSAGQICFAPLANQPEFAAFWWPNYLRIMDWFLQFEQTQRAEKPRLLVETSARYPLRLSPERSLELHGRADRIEQYPDGTFSLYDFKTGRSPTAKEVTARLESQLTVTAALVKEGGFAKVDHRTLRLFDYIKLGGAEGGAPANLPKNIKDIRLDDLVDQHWRGLLMLVKAHWLEGRGFAARLYPPKRNSVGPYDHLARVKEWAVSGEEEEA